MNACKKVLAILIYLYMLVSPGIVFSLKKKVRLEKALPVSAVFLIVFVYLFGLLGKLDLGVITGFAIISVTLVTGIVRTCKNHELEKAVENIFTSGMLWFVLLLLVIAFCIRGKMFDQWDEFSHWGDVVKATVDIDAFSTNADSHSAFQTYPPGMVIFQYIFQYIHIFLGHSFSEWRTYFSYDLFLLCFMAPMFGKITFRKPFSSIAVVICVLLIPSVFFCDTYCSLMIDVAVSAVFGYGLYEIISEEDEEIRTINICAVCLMLPLLKDVGKLLSVFLLVLYSLWLRESIKWKHMIAVCISAFATALLWRINIMVSNATEVFPNKYDLGELLRVLRGGGEEYRRTVLFGYPKALIDRGIWIGNTGVMFNYVVVFALISLLAVASTRRYMTSVNRFEKKVFFFPMMLVIYIVGLCITYMFQFSEYEAIIYASLERYLNIPICGIAAFSVYLFIESMEEKDDLRLGGLVCALLILAPLNNMYDLLSRGKVKESQEKRSRYVELAEKVSNNVDKISTIYIISQEDNGEAFWIYHYLFRPNVINIGQLPMLSDFRAGGYSIGKPYYEGDIWSSDISPNDLMNEWVENYDYIAIFHTNEYFNEYYSNMFKGEIKDNSLFILDKTRRQAIHVD